MQRKVKEFFESLNDPETLAAIRKEVEDNTEQKVRKQRGDPKQALRRGKSQLVLDGIHEILGNDHEECRNAEAPCLIVIIRKYMTKTNARLIIHTLADLLPNLYLNPNVLSQTFTKVLNAIRDKFPDSDIEQEAAEYLHPSKQVSKKRKKDYDAKVYKANNELRPLLDSKILEVINKLQYEEDWPSLTLCVALAVGSRLNEILMTSRYEPATHRNWITVKGVSKDRGDGERIIVKPIVGGLSSEDIISMVDNIRSQFSQIYNADLGAGEGDRKFSREDVTNRANRYVNNKIKEIFGPEYVFHDSRAMYAEMAFAQFSPENMSKTAFFSNVLGHKEDSLSTALSYQRFTVKRKIPEVSADVLSRMTTLEAQMETLKRRREDYKDPYGDAPNEVTLYSRDGNMITYQKQPHVRDKDDVARMNRLISMVIRLTDDNVKTTHANLVKLGFGARIINMWSKGEMPEGFVRGGSQ